MVDQMKIRLGPPPESWYFPIWAWYQWEGEKRRKPDLRAGGPLSTWSEQDFVVALRTGRTPDNRQLDKEWMPWQTFSRMNDLELRAIWRGLRSLPSESHASPGAPPSAPRARAEPV